MPKGRVELVPETGEVRIRFKYNARLVEVVRGLPRRRFDGKSKAWFVPVASIQHVMKHLSPVDFVFSPEVMQAAEKDRMRALRAVKLREQLREEGGGAPQDAESLSPAELNHRVRRTLHQSFSEPMWVVGELSGWRENPSHGVTFFEIVEKDPRSSVARARVQAVLFPEEHAKLKASLARVQSSLSLADGVQVRLKVRVDLFERSGRYQVRVLDVDPYHTIGQIIQRRERILEELEELGLASLNKGLPMPMVPLRVGLITSVGSDAYKDFVHELRRSRFGFDLRVFDARMQGRELERTVVAGLSFFARQKGVDVVAIVRGGGARTELAQFDTMKIALAVCEHPVPVLSGIGHQADQCIVDDLGWSCKTPTAAARALVERVGGALDELNAAVRELRVVAPEICAGHQNVLHHEALLLHRRVLGAMLKAREELSSFAPRLHHGASGCLRGVKNEPEHLQERLKATSLRKIRDMRLESQRIAEDTSARARRVLREGGRDLSRTSQRLERAARVHLQDEERELDRAAASLSARRLIHQFKPRRNELQELQRRLVRASDEQTRRRAAEIARMELRKAAVDPERILSRGFARVEDARGRLIKSPSQVKPGESVHIKVAEGSFGAVRSPIDKEDHE